MRAICRTAFTERIPTLAKIADDAEQPAAVRVKAIETLAKYGLGAMVSGGDADGNITDLPPLTVVAVK